MFVKNSSMVLSGIEAWAGGGRRHTDFRGESQKNIKKKLSKRDVQITLEDMTLSEGEGHEGGRRAQDILLGCLLLIFLLEDGEGWSADN